MSVMFYRGPLCGSGSFNSRCCQETLGKLTCFVLSAIFNSNISNYFKEYLVEIPSNIANNFNKCLLSLIVSFDTVSVAPVT